MSSTKVFDAVATMGTYTNRDGEEKKRYLNVGSVFERDDGSMFMKLDAVPLGEEWSGWVSFYDVNRDRDGGRDRQAQASTGGGTRRKKRADPEAVAERQAIQAEAMDDDIPFAPYHKGSIA